MNSVVVDFSGKRNDVAVIETRGEHGQTQAPPGKRSPGEKPVVTRLRFSGEKQSLDNDCDVENENDCPIAKRRFGPFSKRVKDFLRHIVSETNKNIALLSDRWATMRDHKSV